LSGKDTVQPNKIFEAFVVGEHHWLRTSPPSHSPG